MKYYTIIAFMITHAGWEGTNHCRKKLLHNPFTGTTSFETCRRLAILHENKEFSCIQMNIYSVVRLIIYLFLTLIFIKTQVTFFFSFFTHHCLIKYGKKIEFQKIKKWLFYEFLKNLHRLWIWVLIKWQWLIKLRT